ncbi:hypothetical protein [Streptomyces sp. NBC_01789]|uniref:hypothetical protein n=1 Tax=Streptomyces sp. NBC_01789 TaxID=2975941 RepID=UPI00224D7BAE|nr:hypothetical protein [Streptomyces sp. NBC_01789]MCX4451626.1 hypothetical protein [Streptomyces sp. NBC_01789]
MPSDPSETFRNQLAAATARIQHGNDERTAGADDRARAIAAEVERRGRGGARQVAEELGVSEKTISQAITRARNAPSPNHTLPSDTLERLLAAELETVAPLTPLQWEALGFLVRGTIIDTTWITQPGQLLAWEVEDSELDEQFEPGALAEACRAWNRAQALAVIDACQRDDLAALPVKE